MLSNGNIRSYAVALLTATMAVLAITFLASPKVNAQVARTTDDEIVTHQVILSDKITVYIDTAINAEIKEARLWFRAHGDNNVAAYTYIDFEQSDRIRATGEIDMKPPSYFPPGTQFDIRFEFVSTVGEIYASDTYHVEHIDTNHDWQRVSDENLEIIYYGISDRSIENLHASVAPRLPEINRALGVTDSPQFRAVVFPNARELTLHGPRISQAATDGIYFGGFAYDEYNLTIMASPSAEVLIHELTHLIFARKLTSPFATDAPGWLNEGNSSFWETGNRQRANQQFRSFVRRGDVTEFSKMHSVPGIRADIHRFYIQSADFVGYLHENYGRDSVSKLLEELNSGQKINEAMQTVFGGTLTEIENRWRAEWDLPPVGTPIETNVEINREILPTIPGLPTIETGTLTQLPTNIQSQQSEPQPAPTVDHAAIDIPQPEVATPEPQATTPPQPTAVPATPQIGVGNYVTGTSDADWPTIKPSAVIIFILLFAGFAALFWRRMRT